MASWLWEELREFFATDDGSLPEIRLNFSEPRAVARGLEFLRDRSRSYTPANPEVAESGAFHVTLAGIRSAGVTLPDLGLFVFPDQLALDYRMGPAWGEAEVECLFALLRTLIQLDPAASLSLEDHVEPRAAARFQSAWRRYLTEHAA